MDAAGQLFIWEDRMNANVNYCGIVLLLRQLVASGCCTKKDAIKIADRIAKKTGADIIFSL